METEPLISWTRVYLDAPARTLHRLCKHFSHKVKAEWNDRRGEVDFGVGHCELRADGGFLHCICRAKQTGNLRDIEETIERHLGPMSGHPFPAVHWER